MKLSSLNFTNENKSLEFLSVDRSVIFTFSSKQEALRALADMACEKTISAEEFTGFQEIILNNEEFPWLNDNKKSNPTNQKLADEIIGNEIFSLLTSLEQFGMIGLLVNPFQMMNPFYPSSFLPSNCAGQRGIIWTEVGFSTIVDNKEAAHTLLKTLSKIGEINEAELAEIEKQVDQFYSPK